MILEIKVVKHPWWNKGSSCYKQISGWAWGDSLCIREWPQKTFLSFPNWIEHVVLITFPLSIYTRKPMSGLFVGSCIIAIEHLVKTVRYLPAALKECKDKGILHTLLVAFGAGTILSSQEITRVQALIKRLSVFSICRRVDWFDGQDPRIRLDIQLWGSIRFAINTGIAVLGFASSSRR